MDECICGDLKIFPAKWLGPAGRMLVSECPVHKDAGKMSDMGIQDHPSKFYRTEMHHPPVRQCDLIDDHESHWYNEDPDISEYARPQFLCGGLPRRVISINDAKSKRTRAPLKSVD